MHLAALVAELLDPLLTARGFAAGQTGLHPDDVGDGFRPDPAEPWPVQSGSVLWCAPYDAFQGRYPFLPQALGQDELRDHGCVDLTITLEDGRIGEVTLEGPSLSKTFAGLGRDAEALEAERLLGTPAQSALPVVRRLLTALFDTTEDSASRQDEW